MQSYEKAAVLGSTAALTSLASLYKAEYHQSEINNNSSAKDAALVNVIAYYNLAIKRGDIGAQTRKEVFSDVYNIDLTKQEQSLASKKANITYKEILRKRRDLGLASFEDENSSAAKDFSR
ncbi:hypothetical protein [Marinimicrobium sp. C2-29]|uniref:hypothetical protein n=1 Tax=Marinimicrobium sp. C2-29 TaxID=3139825 RepID=UPI0031390D53